MKLIELPGSGCTNTLGHALVHLKSARAAIEDKEQVLHDIGVAEAVIKNVQEMGKAQ